MNTMEERLWAFIDGSCSEEERREVEQLVATDGAWRIKYEDLLSLEQQLNQIGLEEPSMGFTFKVMEGIRTEYAQQPLKAKFNPKIIRGIAAFFILSIAALLTFMVSSVPIGHVNLANVLPEQFHIPETFFQNPESKYIHGTVLLNIFLMFDLVLALFLVDTYLRRKKGLKQALRP